jgi:hypothetical protein
VSERIFYLLECVTGGAGFDKHDVHVVGTLQELRSAVLQQVVADAALLVTVGLAMTVTRCGAASSRGGAPAVSYRRGPAVNLMPHVCLRIPDTPEVRFNEQGDAITPGIRTPGDDTDDTSLVMRLCRGEIDGLQAEVDLASAGIGLFEGEPLPPGASIVIFDESMDEERTLEYGANDLA